MSYYTGEFQHEMDLTGAHETVLCHQCHSGGAGPRKESCEGCHESELGLITATLPDLEPFAIEPDFMADLVACEDCHTVSEPHSRQAALASCVMCHDDDGSYEALHGENVTALTELRRSVLERVEQEPEADWAERARGLVALLDDAGSHHNAAASRKVLQDLLESP